ncbi:MAG: S8 family serine peptidase [Bacteroidota bacterium]|nr:S8 family serine peptidase [Bacteroidota bacterium]
MKKLNFLLFAILIQGYCVAQNNNNYNNKYDLLLSIGNISLEMNYDSVKYLEPQSNEVFNGYYYRYLQFMNIPITEQKAQMENLGIKLMLYLPNNTYMAAIKVGTNIDSLAPFEVRGIHYIKPEYKLLKELQVAITEDNYPAYPVKDNSVGIGFTFYENIPHDSINAFLQSNAYEIIYQDKATHWYVVWVKQSELLNFVALPFVCSAELMDDVPQPENNVGRTSHRDNAIATDYSGGRKYNGSGVGIMLQDDGIIGPHIDYQGRLVNQFITHNYGDHGDHVAGILMGAGNLNSLTRGMAWGSDIYVYEASPYYQGFDSIYSDYGKYGIRIISTSYSNGCNAGYTTLAQKLDIQTGLMPQLIHVFSGGNNGTSNCNYGAGAGWGNITGGHKHSKNSISIANLDYIDQKNVSSSVGPVHDGRLKPEVSAVGTSVYSTSNPDTYVTKSGTSMSCPGAAGTFAQLYHAYKTKNSNNNPPSALMKAIVMNTADDLGNAGPDFKYGYGRINALKAVRTIEMVNYRSDTISQNGNKTHNILVPSGVRQIKIMTYWHDYQAAIGAGVALVNNLNTALTTPAASTLNPLVLDFTPDTAKLNSIAVPGIDIRNNHEQIVMNNPGAGNYVLHVNGASVPMGPQIYYVTWIFEMDGFTLTYPIGGEGFVPGEIETIRWDAYETLGNQTLEYSTDSGSSWNIISNTIAGTQRYFNWAVPGALSGQCLVRISRGAYSAKSDTNFSIIPLPTNIKVAWACPDSAGLTWTATSGASAYDIFRLGTKYMDSVGTSTTTSYVVRNVSAMATHWFSIRARGPLSAVGRRAIAIQKLPGTFGCQIPNDAACNYLLSPGGTILNCMNLSSTAIKINLYNPGINSLSNIPVFYCINGGPIVSEVYTGTLAQLDSVPYTFTTTANMNTTGNFQIKTWVKYPLDINSANDTSLSSVMVIAGTLANLPLIENFETFNLCATTANCAATVCNLGNGFTNENSTSSDQHDWRVNSGSTLTSLTGPDLDYNPGTPSGKYVYLESSVPCTSLTANMLSPCVDLSKILTPTLRFAYHMYGSDMGFLYVDVFAKGCWTNNVWNMSGDQGNIWHLVNVNLGAWASDIVTIRWRGITGPGFLSDMALDDIMISAPVYVQNLNPINGFHVYPNPANGTLFIEADKHFTSAEILITNVFGQTINKQYFNSQKLALEMAGESGMYFVQIKSDDKIAYFKVLKQ